MKFLIPFLLFPILLFAQNDFDRIPLKGKIKSYTIARMDGDSLNPKLFMEREVTYDDKGRLLTSFEKDTRSYSTAEQEMNEYEGNIIKNYRCHCDDLDKFVAAFTTRDNAELKTMPRYATNQPPTKFVKISHLDKKGNPVSVSYYSSMGYKTGETKSWFDKAGNVVKVEKYDIDGTLVHSVANTYNKQGRLIGEIIKSEDGRRSKYIRTYDEKGDRTEIIGYENDALQSHNKYLKTGKDSYTQFSRVDVLNNKTYIERDVYYDSAGREVKVIRFNPDGSRQSRFESAYDKDGNFTSYSIYYKPDVLSTKYEYTYDAKGNWITMTKHQLVNYQVKGKTEPKMEITKYKREIVYFK